MAKWADLNTRARELADRERRLYDQRTIPTVLEELAAENEALRAERDDLRYRLQAMHRRAQASEGKMARTVYILEAIVGYVKSARSPGDGRWWTLSSMVRSAIDHARRGTGKAMWADCHWYHEYEKRLKSRFAELEAEAARLRAEAENSAAQRDEAVMRATQAEEAKRAVEARCEALANGAGAASQMALDYMARLEAAEAELARIRSDRQKGEAL